MSDEIPIRWKYISILAISLELPKIKFEADPQIQTSIEPTQILPSNDQVDLSTLDDKNRERTLSDASSATVDYDFDSETCAALVSTTVDTNI